CNGSHVSISNRTIAPFSSGGASQLSFTVNESEANVSVGPSGRIRSLRIKDDAGIRRSPRTNVTSKSRKILIGYAHASKRPLSFPSRPECFPTASRNSQGRAGRESSYAPVWTRGTSEYAAPTKQQQQNTTRIARMLRIARIHQIFCGSRLNIYCFIRAIRKIRVIRVVF